MAVWHERFVAPALAFLVSILLCGFGKAWDINSPADRAACQFPTRDPLEGCDKVRTVLVDGTLGKGTVAAAAAAGLGRRGARGGKSQGMGGTNGGNGIAGRVFGSVQSAVEALPNNTETYIILITAGIYSGQVNITRHSALYLLGQTSQPTSYTSNLVLITSSSATGTAATGTRDNAFTSTLTVAPNLNASLTGSGPTGFALPEWQMEWGCRDFRSYNVDWRNDFAPYSAGPALALSISRANGGFYYTRFLSYQDTVYIGKTANAYFSQSEVAGQTDFLYGFGTAFLTKTHLSLRSCGGGITAWKGSNTTFPNKYGIYITSSSIRAANSSIAEKIVGKCALGRPWNSQHRSVVSHTYLDASILPSGYIDWNPSRYSSEFTLLAEYENFGPGWNETARRESKFDTVLDRTMFGGYGRPEKVFLFGDGEVRGKEAGEEGNDAWVDYGV